jgi:glycosyltransferase involved in cell wall biosynthesis
MNILLVNGSSDLYGASRIFFQTAQKLKKNGHQLLVILSEEGALVHELNKVDIPTRIVRLGVLRKKYFSPLGLANRIRILITAFFTIKKICKEQKIDLIYTNTVPVIVGGIASKLLGIKNVWHIHEILPENGFQLRFFGWLINYCSSKVIVVSKAVYDNWSSKISADKLVLVYNGIDFPNLSNQANDFRASLDLPTQKILVGMIGRVNHYKGQGYFLEIVAELNKHQNNCHFVMVGDAFKGYEYLYDQLSAQKKQLGIENQITDLGYRADIDLVMNSLDIFVLPSIKPDPFPTVILEAMAAQKPVVATRQGGACESVVHALTGYLVPLQDPATVAAYILALAQNESLRNEMGIAGRQRFQSLYSIENFETNIAAAFESIAL